MAITYVPSSAGARGASGSLTDAEGQLCDAFHLNAVFEKTVALGGLFDYLHCAYWFVIFESIYFIFERYQALQYVYGSIY